MAGDFSAVELMSMLLLKKDELRHADLANLIEKLWCCCCCHLTAAAARQYVPRGWHVSYVVMSSR